MLKISSRKSDLAKLQSYLVADALKAKNPALEIQFLFKESLGDINLTDPLWKMPEKGVFTEDFNRDLLDETTDMVVHSWKDLPTQNRGELMIAATLPRADQRDLLLVKKTSIDRILKLKKINLFTSSPRRFYNIGPFLKSHFPFGLNETDFKPVRGNIQTRLKKMTETDDIDGLVLAKAALDRLIENNFDDLRSTKTYVRSVLNHCQWMILPLSKNPNAAAQGAMAIETKGTREDLKNIFSQINDPDTFYHSDLERKILASHGGGCHQKIGVASLSHPYGNILFTKGLTDKNVTLFTEELIHSNQSKIKNKFLLADLWFESSQSSYFDREKNESFEFLEKDKSKKLGLLITKTENLPKFLFEINSPHVHWTSGTPSWKKCADLGIWIHGCQDQLGDTYPKKYESLLNENISWLKLSHDQSPPTENHETISTYKLKRNKNNFIFSNKKCFYWSSSSLYLAAVKDHPEIRSLTHCCGAGSTAKIIEKDLNENFFGSDPQVTSKALWNNLFIFYNLDQWRSYVTQ